MKILPMGLFNNPADGERKSAAMLPHGMQEHGVGLREEKPFGSSAADEASSCRSARETETFFYASWSGTSFNYREAASEWKPEGGLGARSTRDACSSGDPGDDGGGNSEPATNMHQDDIIGRQLPDSEEQVSGKQYYHGSSHGCARPERP